MQKGYHLFLPRAVSDTSITPDYDLPSPGLERKKPAMIHPQTTFALLIMTCNIFCVFLFSFKCFAFWGDSASQTSQAPGTSLMDEVYKLKKAFPVQRPADA